MDALARGLRNAADMMEAGRMEQLVAARYASWQEAGGLGEKIRRGKVRSGGWQGCILHAWGRGNVRSGAGRAACVRGGGSR